MCERVCINSTSSVYLTFISFTLLYTTLYYTTAVPTQLPDVEKAVNDAFLQCDVSHTGTLSFSEFRAWCELNPDVMRTLEDVFVLQTWHAEAEADLGMTNDDRQNSYSKVAPDRETTVEEGASNQDLKLSCPTCQWRARNCMFCGSGLASAQVGKVQCSKKGCPGSKIQLTFCGNCGTELGEDTLEDAQHPNADGKETRLRPAALQTQNAEYHAGLLSKRGRKLGRWSSRWVEESGVVGCSVVYVVY